MPSNDLAYRITFLTDLVVAMINAADEPQREAALRVLRTHASDPVRGPDAMEVIQRLREPRYKD